MIARRTMLVVLLPALILAVILLAFSQKPRAWGQDSQDSNQSELPLDLGAPAPKSGDDGGRLLRIAGASALAAATDVERSGEHLVLNAVADTMVAEGYPSENMGDYPYMMAGYDEYYEPHGRRMRSLVAFDLSGQPIEGTVISAKLRVYVIGSWDYPETARTITTYAITDGWNESGITWQNQPGIGTAYGSQTVISEEMGWHEFDVTGLARKWVSGSVANHGIMLRGPELPGEESSWRAFDTREGDYPAQLVIQLGESQKAKVFMPVVAKPAKKVIGPEGGQLEHAYGASLSLPAGSIPQAMLFSIHVQDNAPGRLPSGFTQLGKAVKFEPSDIYFGIPVKLRLPLPAGTDLTKVHLLTYKGDAWQRVAAFPHDGYLEAGVTSFSWFVATIDPAPDEYQAKAFKLTNRTHEDVVVRLRSWVPRYQNQQWMLAAANTTLGLGQFDFWRSDQGCMIVPQGEYTFWVYSPKRDVSCWIGPYGLGPNDSPWCWAGKPVDFDLLWSGPRCWPGDPTGNVPGRPVLATGSLQFILTWSTYADLDLHVNGPDGYIWYEDAGPTANGGALSIDIMCNNWPGAPAAENVFWPIGRAPSGDFTVAVTYFSDCGTGARDVPYTLQIVNNGSYGWRSDKKVAEPYPVRGIAYPAIPVQSKWIYNYTR